MDNPIIMHINYCEQGQSIHEVCQKAVAWGFDGVEFRSKRKGIEENFSSYLEEVARAVEASGLRKVLFGIVAQYIMDSDADKRDVELTEIGAFLHRAAQLFDLDVCNTNAGFLWNLDPSVGRDFSRHGSAIASEEQYVRASNGFKALGDVAGQLGIKLAFEVHMGTIHDLPSTTMKLLNMIDSPFIGANLDYGNVAYFKDAPSLSEAIDTIGSKLFYLHLKNSIALPDGNRFAVGLGDGHINHREYISLLKRIGYSGPICIEAPRPGDREYYAAQDLAYIKSLVS